MRSLSILLIGFGLFGCSSSDEAIDTDDGALNASPSPAADPALGIYKLDPEVSGVGGTLTIQSLRPFVFNLLAAAGESGRNGRIADGVADFEENTAVFGPSEDCNLVLTLREEAVEVKQTGTCASMGFGAWVDSSGTYLKRPGR